jgi:glycosyltransferase involved in cell wall biosynthesis
VKNNEMPTIYSNADVYVAMPIEESFGQVYIEAIACGLPVISTDTIGANAILEGKAFANVIPQGDITGMASQMNYLLSHPAILPSLAAKARTEFDANYDWNIIIPRYIETYKMQIAKRRTNVGKTIRDTSGN